MMQIGETFGRPRHCKAEILVEALGKLKVLCRQMRFYFDGIQIGHCVPSLNPVRLVQCTAALDIQVGTGTVIENNIVSSSGADRRGQARVSVAARSFAVGSGPIDAVLCS